MVSMDMRWLDSLLRRSRARPPDVVLPRLDWYVAQLGRYRVWVCLGDVWSPWLNVHGCQDGIVTTEGPVVPLAAVQAYVVAYPGGTVVDQEPRTSRRLPIGAHYLPDLPRVAHLLTQRDFVRGREWIAVTFAPCAARPDDRRYHTTTLRNNGLDGVRVVRFGAYRADRMVWRLDTITGGFFTESDFREWYGVPDGWIESRGWVSDLTAFSQPGTLWAYELETQGGDRFWTAGTRSTG
jgi:hypothetical protein